MGVLTSYTDDTTTTADDKYLTVDSSGATKLTPASTLKTYIQSPKSVTASMIDWTGLHRFSAYSAVTNSLAATAFSKLNFATEEFDVGSVFASSRFTATIAGYYSFSAACEITGNNGESYMITLYKDGVECKRGDKVVIGGTGTNTIELNVNVTNIYLTAGQYIEVYAYNGSGGGKTVSAGQALTYFNGALLALG